jgi:hypothetical protein
VHKVAARGDDARAGLRRFSSRARLS